MSDFDWKTLLPVVGAAVTGNVPGAIVAAANAISDVLGFKVEPTPESVDVALRQATPEQLLGMRKIEADLKVRFRELDTEDKKTDAQLVIEHIKDVANARQFNANTHGILILGYLINLTSYACIGGVLYGCFAVLANSGKLSIDPGIAAMLGGIVGAAVQWLMSNAAQANAFFFGSSPSSRQVSSELARAVGEAGKPKP